MVNQPKKTARRRPRQLEALEQRALIAWACRARLPSPPDPAAKFIADYLFTIPNGGTRRHKEAAMLKAEGVKAGVSDLLLPVPNGKYSGLWIEMKAGKNRPTELQKQWGTRMILCGFDFRCCWGFLAAKHAIEEHLGIISKSVLIPPRR